MNDGKRDKIFIRKLTVFGNHGVFPEENTLGQKFIVSAVLHVSTRKAGKSDELKDSINYGAICHSITNFIQKNTYKLLEKVVEELAEKLLLTVDGLEMIELTLEKPWAPVGLPLDSLGVSIIRGWHDVYVALGSNMGDKKDFLDRGVRALDGLPTSRVVKVADYMSSAPYGGIEQDDFLNSVLYMRTLLPPDELLDEIHKIEAAEGRERTIRWGPRTLDLDILFYDDLIIDEEDLQIPHKDIIHRSFVLKPLCELAPHLRHPLYGETVEEMLAELEGN